MSDRQEELVEIGKKAANEWLNLNAPYAAHWDDDACMLESVLMGVAAMILDAQNVHNRCRHF